MRPRHVLPTPMHGIHASLVTPFTRSGEVDAKSLERLAVHCLEQGADGLVALGTTGEAALLTAEERRTVVEVCRAVSIEHGAPLTVGAGTMGTADTIRKAREHAAYADALLVVVPYYLRPSDDGVIDHFAAVGAAVDVPRGLALHNALLPLHVDLWRGGGGGGGGGTAPPPTHRGPS
ncbi:dihydrodipicolinate synthase family protein, partial [Actinomadura physcomitrii]|uniref:dihydrodipicolinate synthase family protein n=1 Tax=Actinomadura physcomitrii TaxID=2650748 RepID=UPI001920F5EF